MKASLALSLPEGKGGLYLFVSGASTSLEGEEGLSHLCWVSTLKEGPALGILRASEYFGTKVALWCPRSWGGLNNSTALFMECLKHQGNLALIFLRSVPTPEERPATARSYCPQGV